MRSTEFKGAIAFALFLIIAGLFVFGFLLFAVALMAVGLLIFLGFYAYIRVKIWWAKRHPPKELESVEDYWG